MSVLPATLNCSSEYSLTVCSLVATSVITCGWLPTGAELGTTPGRPAGWGLDVVLSFFVSEVRRAIGWASNSCLVVSLTRLLSSSTEDRDHDAIVHGQPLLDLLFVHVLELTLIGRVNVVLRRGATFLVRPGVRDAAGIDDADVFLRDAGSAGCSRSESS